MATTATHEIHPIDPAKREAIVLALARIEREHDVRVLFACESGSRGWGFASPDSDYDARFVYVHPLTWYLSVNEATGPGEPQRDVIELPISDDLDVSGWDLRKTFRLAAKSNPTLSEWLRSPIVYRQDDVAVEMLRALAEAAYSPLSSWYHYRSMAEGNFRGYLRGDSVRTKKYLYVLRPVLVCLWIESVGTPPPMAFEDLLDRLLPRGPVRDAIDALLVVKRRSAEVGDGPRIPAISQFVEEQLERMAAAAPSLARIGGLEPAQLDVRFRRFLGVG